MYRNRRINKNNKFNYKKLLEFEYISFVVPIYNEEKRLPFLFNYLKNYSRKNKHKEVIFVDDGSNDKSKVMIKNFIIKNKEKNINYKLISYKKNMGKGYALKKGILNKDAAVESLISFPGH